MSSSPATRCSTNIGSARRRASRPRRPFPSSGPERRSSGPAVAGILTGSLVVETVFAIPGLGIYFVKAAELRDYTLAMGVVLLYTLILYTMNFLVDLSYAYLDPRVDLE